MRLVVALVVVVLVGAALFPVAAQEPTVPELQGTIAALQTQVAHMQGTPDTVAFRFDGAGDTLTQPVPLVAGSYAVTFTCAAGPRPRVTLDDLTPEVVVLFFDVVLAPGKTETVALLQVARDTRVVGQIACDGAWTVQGVTLQ
jgi:hypothetical protein